MKAMNQYWHLMTMANCVMLPPNSVVFTYLNLHLRRCCLLGHTEEGKFSQFCLKSVHRTFKNRGRKYPPSYKEILFVTKRQPIEGRVYLADGHPMLIEFDSAATVAEVIEVIKAKVGVRLDADGFALYQCIGEREEHIALNTKLADCLYQWEKSSRINHSSSKDLKLIFKKRLFVEPFLNLKDPVEVDLLYNQSVTDVFEQKIPLTKTDAIHLCALRAQAEYGDYGHANTIDYNSVVRILPRHLRDLMVLSEISAVHRTLMGTSPLVANIAFLDILKQWPLYGAVLYEVSHSGLDYLPRTLWLAVSQLGLHLMEFKGQAIYSTYLFDEIGECLPANKTLTITTASDSQILMFFTSEANQIVQLINDYREVLAQRRKETGPEVDASCLPDETLLHLMEPLKAGSAIHDHRTHERVALNNLGLHHHHLSHRQKATKLAAVAGNPEAEPLVEVAVRIDSDPGGDLPERLEQQGHELASATRTWSTLGGMGAAKNSMRGHSKYQRIKEGLRHSFKQSSHLESKSEEMPD